MTLLGGNSSTYTPMNLPQGTAHLPASSNSHMGTAPMAAHGGRIKRGKMIAAHMQPHEMNVLDFIQGKTEKCPRSGFRSYSHLEELLKNPHIMSKAYDHVRESHARGGHIGHMQRINPHAGMHGDTEIALIGPHTHRMFDHMAKIAGIPESELRNPHDGHPQYFSFGDIFSGIGNAITGGLKDIGGLASHIPGVGGLINKGLNAVGSGVSSVGNLAGGLANQAAPLLGGLAKAAGPALGGMIGARFGNPALGSQLGGMAGNLLGSLGSSGSSNPMAAAAGNALGQGLNAYAGGASPSQAMGSAMNSMGGAMGNQYGGMGHAMQGFGQGMQEGQGVGQSMGRGISQMGSQYGGGMGGAMRGFGNAMQSGYSPMQAMAAGARGGYEGAGGMPGMIQGGMNALQGFRSGRSPMSMMHNMYTQARPQTMDEMGNQEAMQQLPFYGEE